MAFTVAPLQNLRLPVGSQVPFGNGLFLRDVPGWIKNDKGTLDHLSWHHRDGIKNAQHAFVAEYDAVAIGEPDPGWTGNGTRPIQDAKTECVILANLALWTIQPAPVCFTNVFHALCWPGRTDPIIQQTETDSPLLCHPADENNPVWLKHVIKAAELHKVFCSMPRGNPVWESLRAFWAGLTLGTAERRIPFFWLGLEALFGPDDGRGVSRRLRERISIFLADSSVVQDELIEKVKTCYNTRSVIMHGRWEQTPEIDSHMSDTEAIVRTVIRRLTANQQMLVMFMSDQRDDFLERWVLSKSFDPPPLSGVSVG